MFLSVVIPAYNEVSAIRSGKLHRVTEWLASQSFSSELLVVNDGSLDETADLAKPIAGQVICIPHSGKAAALVAGIQQAQGEVVLLTDMDQATPIAEAPRLLLALQNGTEIAIGSRGLVRPGAPPGRYLLSGGQVVLRSLLIGLRILDTQCGFKAIRRAAALEVLEHLYLYHPGRRRVIQGASVTSGFDVEFLFVAKRLGYRIAEVPVTWNYQETRRVSLVRDSLRGIQDLLNIRMADWKGNYPKAVLR